MKALITGATSGIGQSIARQLSLSGWELILTGRNEKMLRKMQSEMKTKTEIIKADLSENEDVFKVYDFCRGKSVDMLVNNAGYGIFGKFDETDLGDEINMINVNITALHILTKLFLRDFKKRNSGMILNVASSAGFMTGPLLSSYYASKNYVVRLSLAIAEELRHDHSKVTITVLCPGPVDTNFNNRAGVRFSIKPAPVDEVAKYAIEKTLSGKLIAIPTLSIKAGVLATKFIPTKMLSAITYHIQKKKVDKP